jgi:hypothetical protein
MSGDGCSDIEAFRRNVFSLFPANLTGSTSYTPY